MVEMETVLTEEKDSLANELRRISYAFDTLKTNNDTLNANLARDKEKIVQILAINESNVRLIRQYKKEIKTMREIMKSYIVQIDSLNTRNKMLVAENTEIRQEIKSGKEYKYRAFKGKGGTQHQSRGGFSNTGEGYCCCSPEQEKKRDKPDKSS